MASPHHRPDYPEREQRIEELSRSVAAALKPDKSSFDLDELAGSLAITPRDLSLVQEPVYKMALATAWRDRRITAEERKGLDWVARSLHLSEKQAADIGSRVGVEVFQQALADAIDDGVIDRSEIDLLQQIAVSIGTTVRTLVVRYFEDWAEGFLRAMFLRMAEDGNISEREWNNLVSSAEAIGLHRAELLQAIRKQAERFVEHVLLDAKADGRLSQQESKTLDFLLTRLGLPGKFHAYVEEEVRQLKQVTEISMGKLPCLQVNDAGLRAGEIVHFHGSASYGEVKQLKSGPHVLHHQGRTLITDYRLIFNSPTRTFELNHRKVAGIRNAGNILELRTTSRGGGRYEFGSCGKMAFLIFDAAVRKANQTLVERVEGLPNRHISRDVRQRVYQRYGGQYAECGSTQYIEYDHIIPVAKGGSNSEQNVQILCRRCNLKKSDNI